MLKVEPKQQVAPGSYASPADFCRIFKQEMKRLYLLAFMLTANHAKAEACFLAALADAGKEGVVFNEVAVSWSRRLIIMHAIRLITPTAAWPAEARDPWQDGEIRSSPTDVINRVTHLRPLERFVFVLSVLERYGDVECAILLDCTRKEVIEARKNAFENLGTFTWILLQKGLPSDQRDQPTASAPPPAAA